MKGAKGFARDRKTKNTKNTKKTKNRDQPYPIPEEDEADHWEDDILDRKARRCQQLAEKRRCKKENRNARQALQQAAKLQRSVRQLTKELTTVIAAADAPPPTTTDAIPTPVITPDMAAPPKTTDPLPALEQIQAVLQDAVEQVQANNEWDDVEELAPSKDAVADTAPSKEAVEAGSAADAPSTLQRLKNWLW